MAELREGPPGRHRRREDRPALWLENRRPHPHQERGYGSTGTWEFNLDGIYHSEHAGGDETQFWFQWDYFEERVPQTFKGNIGWYVVKLDSPDNAVSVANAIDNMTANSSFETKTETESAFAASWVKQFGNIQFLILTIGTVVFFTLLLVTGNTMAISVRERSAELAVLKAIGFSDRWVLFLVLAESLTLRLSEAFWALGLRYLAVPALGAALNGLLPNSSCHLRFFLSGLPPLCWLESSADCYRESAPCACAWSMRSEGLDGYPDHLQHSQRQGSLDVVHRCRPGYCRNRRRLRGHAYLWRGASGPPWSPPVPLTTPSSCAPAPPRR